METPTTTESENSSENAPAHSNSASVGKQLQFDDQAALLDVIDDLVARGLTDHVDLPRIIVCGDQSSGKSSVLEAISRIRFPVKSTLCTTFPTELVMRRTFPDGPAIKIVPPSKDSSPVSSLFADKAVLDELGKFNETYSGPDDIPQLIEKARERIRSSGGPNTLPNACSMHTLNIQIQDPNWPPLTMVDLPGLIHTTNPDQPRGDIDLVKGLVRSYMENERTIILMIVSAANDIAGQVIFEHVKDCDPDGKRTLGVITKPDELALPPNGRTEQYLTLLRNELEGKRLKLGWHVVRNRALNEGKRTTEERDAAEKEFFASGPWVKHAGESHVGIDALRSRLSEILHQHIVASLPDIVQEINQKLKDTNERLAKLGRPRSNPATQRQHLTQIAEDFQKLAQAACDGNYTVGTFFEHSEGRKLRAIAQDLNDDFADLMSGYGHNWDISDVFQNGLKLDSNSYVTSNKHPSLGKPETISKAKFLEKIREQARSTRGLELRGSPNPRTIWFVFKDLASRWTAHAEHHVETVWKALNAFIEGLFATLSDRSIFQALKYDIIVPEMELRRKKALAKLAEISTAHTRAHPITYNPLHLRNINDAKARRQKDKEIQAQVTSVPPFASSGSSLFASSAPSEEVDRFASEDVLDCVHSYYTIAMNTFVDNVAVLVIENCLLHDLVGMFSPSQIATWDEQKLHRLASESRETLSERQSLTRQLEVLNTGLKKCNDHLRYIDYDLSSKNTSRTTSGVSAKTDKPKITLNEGTSGGTGTSTGTGTGGSVLFGSPSSTANKVNLSEKPANLPFGSGLFGAAKNTPTSGGLFGAATNTPTNGGLFGVSANTSTSGSVFANSPATPAAGGLFGSSPKPTSGGLFANIRPATGGFGGFGPNTPAKTTPGFGQPSPKDGRSSVSSQSNLSPPGTKGHVFKEFNSDESFMRKKSIAKMQSITCTPGPLSSYSFEEHRLADYNN